MAIQEGEAPPAAAALLAARDFLLGADEGGDVDLGSVDARARERCSPSRSRCTTRRRLRAALIEVLARASERAASRHSAGVEGCHGSRRRLRPVEVEEEAPAPEYPFAHTVTSCCLY